MKATVLRYKEYYQAHECKMEDGKHVDVDLTINGDFEDNDPIWEGFPESMIGKIVEIVELRPALYYGVGVKVEQIGHSDLIKLKRAVTEPRLAIQEQVKKLASIGYTCSCILCNSTSGLTMVAHRDEQLRMVGWIFLCPSCQKTMQDKRLDWTISDCSPRSESAATDPDTLDDFLDRSSGEVQEPDGEIKE